MREGNYQVDFVVDGDTLELRGGIRVRLIGVDTPETVKRDHPVDPCGPEATQFTRGFLAAGRADLRFDAERVDRHGRTLAYVSVDGKLLNEELILAGLGRYEPRFHYQQSMHRRFRLAEQAAKSAGRGLWSVRPCAQEPAK